MKEQIVRPLNQILDIFVIDPYSGKIEQVALNFEPPARPLYKGKVERFFRQLMVKSPPSECVGVSITTLREGVKSALASKLSENQSFHNLRSAIHNLKLNKTRGRKDSGVAYVRS